jgi:ppGpp synthetase/RelA/SpoT-type nucleotidyltranferase
MSYPTPPNPKSNVKRAGRAIGAGTATEADFDLVDQWRSSHGYVINTFQAWLKGQIKKKNYNVEFAQRLKRRATVIDKLKRVRPDGQPLIQDVTSMQDLAGCRLVFETLDELIDFRSHMRSEGVLRNVKHKLKNDEDKFDYIECPKDTGYRGIHDVYRHQPRQHRRTSVSSDPWHGLLVEVQYRTRTQHAWATAVEISDMIDQERTKFVTGLDNNADNRVQFFRIASEIIARTYENKENALLEKSTNDLQDDLQNLENDLHIMDRLEALKSFSDGDSLGRHSVLNIVRENDVLNLQVLPFKNAEKAIFEANRLELLDNSINAVYVRSDNPSQLRSIYRNYFNDPVDFVKLLKSEAELK